ncbi:MAG: cell wall-binding repeat-containing protein [Actinobacteria bacterium]|nr:cell wall-binding repeat-containing protein [Actinomycetota bacterium]
MRLRRSLSVLVTALSFAALLPAVAGAAEPYEATIDLTFPTVGSARFGHDYHQARSGGRQHKATDLLVPKHTPAYAAVDGTVCFITGIDEPMPSWGYSLSICGEDGRSYRYIHLNNDRPGTDDGLGGPEHAYAPGIRRGTEVARGQLVAWIGDSGNAESTASHLHFEIHDDRVTDPYGDHRIDPYFSLVAAKARGDVPTGAVVAPSVPSTRVAGADRVATAIALSRTAYPSATVAVVAPSTFVAEAVVAGPLAAALGGPVLTTHPSELDPRLVGELRRLGVERVVAVGLPGAVAASLGAAGVAVERVGASDRYGLAAAVAARLWQAQGLAAARSSEAGGDTSVGREVVLALGEHPDPSRAWPDSLMASYYGAATGAPVLLVGPGTLPDATVSALAGVARVTIIGGEAAVPFETASALRGLGIEVQRLGGATRYSTALAVSDDLVRRGLVTVGDTWVATARNWPDAATSGPVVARRRGLLVLVDGEGRGADAETQRFLSRRAGAIERIVGIGGGAAVTAGALASAARWAT